MICYARGLRLVSARGTGNQTLVARDLLSIRPFRRTDTETTLTTAHLVPYH